MNIFRLGRAALIVGVMSLGVTTVPVQAAAPVATPSTDGPSAAVTSQAQTIGRCEAAVQAKEGQGVHPTTLAEARQCAPTLPQVIQNGAKTPPNPAGQLYLAVDAKGHAALSVHGARAVASQPRPAITPKTSFCMPYNTYWRFWNDFYAYPNVYVAENSWGYVDHCGYANMTAVDNIGSFCLCTAFDEPRGVYDVTYGMKVYGDWNACAWLNFQFWEGPASWTGFDRIYLNPNGQYSFNQGVA